ncbi:hypothetical protein LZ189_04430, partial [Rhodovulum sulfidophilum]|nr:hypothetical protein [Rhodovulum sulfidophilum]
MFIKLSRAGTNSRCISTERWCGETAFSLNSRDHAMFFPFVITLANGVITKLGKTRGCIGQGCGSPVPSAA